MLNTISPLTTPEIRARLPDARDDDDVVAKISLRVSPGEVARAAGSGEAAGETAQNEERGDPVDITAPRARVLAGRAAEGGDRDERGADRRLWTGR